MSKIECRVLPIDQWVKERMEQLTRIDNRINKNLEKYRKRKSSSLDRSGGSESRSDRGSRESGEGRDALEIRESTEYEYDEIADDWRKLWDTITGEIPIYMQKTSSSKAMNKITTIQQQAKRVAMKIESRLELSDLEDYRYKQNLKKWEGTTKASLIRVPRLSADPEKGPEYEEIQAEEEKVQRSLIVEDLNSIGRDSLNQLDKAVSENEKLVGEYEVEKQAERRWLKVLLALIAVFIVFDQF